MIIKFYLCVYRVWSFLILPISISHLIIEVLTDNRETDLFFFLFISILIFINYLLVIKNKFSYWLTFLIIPFIVFNAIHIFKFSNISLGLFSSFEEKEKWLSSLGIMMMLSLWYIWSGVEYFFLSYKNIKLSNIGLEKFDLGFMKMPNSFKSPLVISILILVIGAISILAYHRYTDPYNQCLRALKEVNSSSSEIWRIQRCSAILKEK